MQKLHVYVGELSSCDSRVTGNIYFDFGKYQFPEKDWNDFAVTILCWWLSSLRSLLHSNSYSEKLRFMDGPLHILIDHAGDGICEINCIDNGRGILSEYSASFPLNEIIKSILEAAIKTLNLCKEKNLCNDEISDLANYISELLPVSQKLH